MRQLTLDEAAMLEMKTGEQKGKNVMLKKIFEAGKLEMLFGQSRWGESSVNM
jgi:hypothetical protein